jgi:hypothetical protein
MPSTPPVHLAENSPLSKRSLTTGRAYPLGELDRPHHTGLENILGYLDVETSARYQRTATNTFCNIYACDYCYLAGAYLPRVWWTPQALATPTTQVKYGQTVAELNANSLYIWLRDFGPAFGWSRATSTEPLQNAANSGQVSVICAQRQQLDKSGHIALVVPASSITAVPLQSQAGRINYSSSRKPGRWWENPQFQAFGFWTHAK